MSERDLMIVKVQLPLSSNEVEPMALVYDENRQFEVFLPVTDGLKQEMSGLPKKYFYAYFDDESKNTVLVKPALSQSW